MPFVDIWLSLTFARRPPFGAREEECCSEEMHLIEPACEAVRDGSPSRSDRPAAICDWITHCWRPPRSVSLETSSHPAFRNPCRQKSSSV
ncbi:hypothetical protein OE88DRAFT_1371179 [Heliocybe sulcata]|uniref:Uncharacterized protein n=1 Tax=Heliocybe sulcata TaxID=5364 RepID=A0A5C3N6T9_9AGAM|nr:hypothetical protein OE88DRAFT_1371179 [Heliocybe sulcata]